MMKLLRNNKDIFVVLAFLGTLVAMVLPFPAYLLDMFLTVSLTMGVLIMMVSIYLMKPLDFSSFPTVLLMATLFRLSMNVATTRRILLDGNRGVGAAGKLIESFGQFVVGGNYVVGIIVFIILVLINFLVITKGSGRIAEVSARFTLDALPGKQMSIDADLNAGLITEAEARKKRVEIAREADFYGSMDGASKFVRGDAIAGIIITIVNIVGGIIIGVAQEGMALADAASTYTILTVGDGLVSQIPSLLIATSAGIIVTRAGSSDQVGEEVIGQLFRYAKALMVVGGVLFLLGLVPGFPLIIFWIFGGFFIVLGIQSYSYEHDDSVGEDADAEGEESESEESPDEIESALGFDLMELELGYAVIPVADTEQGGQLLDKIMSIRKQFANDLGIVIPPIHIQDNLDLEPEAYRFRIKGVDVAKGTVDPDKYLLINSSEERVPFKGENTTEPAFGLPARWIDEKDTDSAREDGFVVVDPATVIATHITEAVKNNAYEIIGREELQKIIDIFSKKHPKLVEELIPEVVPMSTLLKVIRNLLKENLSVKDMRTILETLADYSSVTKDPEYLTEFVRQNLGAQISNSLKSEDGSLYALTMEPSVELKVKEAFKENGSINPGLMRNLLSQIDKKAKAFADVGANPVIITSPDARRFVKRIIERSMPSVSVISTAEMGNEKVETLGMIGA